MCSLPTQAAGRAHKVDGEYHSNVLLNTTGYKTQALRSLEHSPPVNYGRAADWTVGQRLLNISGNREASRCSEKGQDKPREDETLLKESKADNLTNDIYTPTLMSRFMSGNSLRAAAGWQGLGDQYQVHNEAHRCNYIYDSLVYGQSLPPSSHRRVSRWPSLQMLRVLETLASPSKVINVGPMYRNI